MRFYDIKSGEWLQWKGDNDHFVYIEEKSSKFVKFFHVGMSTIEFRYFMRRVSKRKWESVFNIFEKIENTSFSKFIIKNLFELKDVHKMQDEV